MTCHTKKPKVPRNRRLLEFTETNGSRSTLFLFESPIVKYLIQTKVSGNYLELFKIITKKCLPLKEFFVFCSYERRERQNKQNYRTADAIPWVHVHQRTSTKSKKICVHLLFKDKMTTNHTNIIKKARTMNIKI